MLHFLIGYMEDSTYAYGSDTYPYKPGERYNETIQKFTGVGTMPTLAETKHIDERTQILYILPTRIMPKDGKQRMSYI